MITKLFRSIIIILFLLLLVVFYLLGTPSGLQLSFSILSHSVPGTLSVTGISGSLLNSFTIDNLNYKNTDFSFSAEHLTLKWQPLILLKGIVDVKKLTAKTVELDLLTNQHTATDRTTSAKKNSLDFNLPFSINLHQLKIDQLAVLYGTSRSSINIEKLVAFAQANNNSDTLKLAVLGKWQRLTSSVTELNLYSHQGEIKIYGNWLNYQFGLTTQLKGNNIPNNLIKINGEGHWDEKTNLIIFAINQIQGQFNGYPIQGKSLFQYHNQTFSLKDTFLQIGDALLTAEGKLNQTLNASWKIHIPDLHKLLIHSAGVIEAKGVLTSNAAQSDVTMALHGQNLQYADTKIERFTTQLDFTLHPNRQINLQLSAKKIYYHRLLLDQFTISLQGSTLQHILNVNLSHSLQKIYFKLAGGWLNNQWKGQVQSFVIDTQSSLGHWQLTKPTELLLSPTRILVPTLCWQSISAQLCSSISWQQGQSFLSQLDLKQFNLSQLKDFMPSGTKLIGFINLNAHVSSQPSHSPQADITLHLGSGKISHLLDNTQRSLPFQGGNLIAHLSENGLDTMFNFMVSQQASINAKFSMPGYKGFSIPSPQQTVNGSLIAQLTKLEQFSFLLPKRTSINGKFITNVALNGSWGKPIILGTVNLENAAVNLPIAGINLKAINARLTADNTEKLQFVASMKSGVGVLKANGNYYPFSSIQPTIIALQGQNFLISNTPEIRVIISPQLTIKILNNRLDLQGIIAIPESHIAPKDFSSTVQIPSDTVYTGSLSTPTPLKQNQNIPSATEEAPSALQVYSHLQLNLGDKVNFNFRGLAAQLGGQLTITDTPQGNSTAVGDLIISKGEYKAYGQNLTIRQGRLSFAGGPLDNPILNIQAIRQVKILNTSSSSTETSSAPTVQDTVVGIQISGTAEAPVATLFSIPSGLDQTQILSYLVLGRTLDQASSTDGKALAQAALSMNLGGGKIAEINNKLKTLFGLSELDVAPESEYNATSKSIVQNTALIVGKYLTPKLYVNYSIGLIEPINTLRVNYQLTPRWLLQTETNTDASGIDIIYKIDTDHRWFK